MGRFASGAAADKQNKINFEKKVLTREIPLAVKLELSGIQADWVLLDLIFFFKTH